MAKNVGHICSISDKYCQEGANPNRHDSRLPANHPTQHSSHMGGCICSLGDGEVHECVGIVACIICDEAQRLPEWAVALENMRKGNPLWSIV